MILNTILPTSQRQLMRFQFERFSSFLQVLVLSYNVSGI
jgi:hypothetical protein